MKCKNLLNFTCTTKKFYNRHHTSVCYSLPVRLAFDAIEEVEPEVTAAAAAAIEVDVGKAVMEEAAEDDPGKQC